jgi:hypothetical protein
MKLVMEFLFKVRPFFFKNGLIFLLIFSKDIVLLFSCPNSNLGFSLLKI